MECSNPEGRKLTDLLNAYGGANDLDGNGSFNLNDMIYGLNFLFSGGPPPCPLLIDDVCPIVQPVCPGPLPATGQTNCCDETNRCDLECTDPAVLPGQDASYEAGCSSSLGRFVDNGDGTVTDTCTGLMWQKDTPNGIFAWEEALRECESLDLAGHNDWRLPNVRELESLINYGRVTPAIASAFFPGTMQEFYWCSTTRAYSPGYAWVVHFGNGGVTVDGRGATYRIRAVRSIEGCRGRLPATGQTWCYAPNGYPANCETAAIPGQDGAYMPGCPDVGRFKDNGDGTVTDNCTGLMWQKDPPDTNDDGAADGSDLIAWQDALGFCQSLITTKGGALPRWASDNDVTLGELQPSDVLYDDWRIPNARELMSIMDYGRVAPAVDTVFFGWPGSTWTSTTYAADSNYAWYAAAEAEYSGLVSVTPKSNPIFVRAVRGGLTPP